MPQTTRVIQGVAFEFESPSHFRPTGLPVEIRFTEHGWRLDMLWRDVFTSAEYPTREAAIAVIAQALGRQL